MHNTVGITANIIEIQPMLVEEWNAMTPEEKAQIVEEEEEEWNLPAIKCPSAHSQIVDVTNVKQNMQALVQSSSYPWHAVIYWIS